MPRAGGGRAGRGGRAGGIQASRGPLAAGTQARGGTQAGTATQGGTATQASSGTRASTATQANSGTQAGAGGSLARRCYAHAHPVTWLRWLRVVAVIMIAATAVLGWLETAQAHRVITLTSTRGARAIADVAAAQWDLGRASQAVQASFAAGAVALTGPGETYTALIASSAQDLVLTAEDNVAGQAGSDQVRFADGQLSSYRTQVDLAGNDFAAGDPVLARAELGYAAALLNTLNAELAQLGMAELDAVTGNLGSPWLATAVLWLLPLALLAALLALAAWTSYVLSAGFRRLLSAPLIAAVLATLGLVVLVAAANSRDSQHAQAYEQRVLTALAAHHKILSVAGPDAAVGSSGWMLLAGLALAGGAAVLAFRAYQPRLREYA